MTEFCVSDETIHAAKLAMEQKGYNYTGSDGKKSISAVVGKNPLFVAGVINGNQRLSTPDTAKLTSALGLSAQQTAEYNRHPRRKFTALPNDPFNYRLIEIIANYGDPMREIVNELFNSFSLPGSSDSGRGGDGIMSAIDYSMHLFRRTEGNKLPDFNLQEADPKMNNRCTLVLDGKWLNIKAFGW